MAVVCYTVRCQFTGDDPGVADRWVDWLRNSHISEVLACGAYSAEIVKLSGHPIAFEIRYRFPNRDVYERYIRDDAPRLRADGLRRFPLELGLGYSRNDGDIVYSVP